MRMPVNTGMYDKVIFFFKIKTGQFTIKDDGS